MKVPISWLKDFVDIEIPIPELAHRLTLAGLEVEEIRYVGLPLPAETVDTPDGLKRLIDTNVTGIEWDPEKIVVGAVLEVMPHPDADRLVLCRIDDGEQEHVVVTGAPNLFPYKGQGELNPTLRVAYAREGAQLLDGHSTEPVLFTLKRTKLRGVDSYSMACSEKELGISEDHEGVILLDEDAPVGMPLVDYMGDAVLDITLTPNVARNANMIGVAREVAAITGVELREPSYDVPWTGPKLDGRVGLKIEEPELNPRFVLGLVEGIEIHESPYRVTRRLQLAGMRPINNVVDATNYVMLEVGEPLHAFDFDVLVERAGQDMPMIITRLAKSGERLTTLDDIERELDDFTVLVTDTAGALSLAGVMGGVESEVSDQTVNVLLEGAAWNYINTRKTVAAQGLSSEAAFRFERGVHPALAERGVRRGLQFMAELTGGTIAEGLVDEYPLPPSTDPITVSPEDCQRWLGVELELDEMAGILRRLEFDVQVEKGNLRVLPPDHRLDIGEGIVGVADLMEEIARIYGYDRLPETMIADQIPPQYRDLRLQNEEMVRDLLVDLGLQEVVTYRLTTPEKEGWRLAPGTPADDRPYIEIANPISSERLAMRHSLLASVFEIAEKNARLRDRLALFEIGPIYMQTEDRELPEEALRLVIVLTGRRWPRSWQEDGEGRMDFFDLKGIMESMLDSMKVDDVSFKPAEHPTFHPGKCAHLSVQDVTLGTVGEVHPAVLARYELDGPVAAADIDLGKLLNYVPDGWTIAVVPVFPPVLEDLAIIVDEPVPSEQVVAAIWSGGGQFLREVRLFDLYRGEQIGSGKKSLAYALTFQAVDRTLTDEDVAKARDRILKVVKKSVGGVLRA